MAKELETYEDLYPSRFIRAADLKGRQVKLTIASVFHEVLTGEKGDETKVILAFKETPKQYVAPKIVGVCIREMFGRAVANWIGKRVVFYPTADLMPLKRGEPCVRVWGSPDIERDMTFQWTPPRRKAITLTVRCVRPSLDSAGRTAVDDATPEPPPEA